MPLLLHVLVVVLVLVVIYWAAHKLAAAFGAPGPVLVIIDVVLVLYFVFYVLSVFGLLPRLT